MRTSIFLIAAAVCVLWQPVEGRIVRVQMSGLTFVPDTVAVQVGDSVRWTNSSSFFHTTTSGVNGVPNGIWDSGLMAPNDSFTFGFTQQGNFPYYCTPHWPMGMVGRVRVIPTGITEETALTRARIKQLKTAPEPFTSYTNITFAVDRATRVELTVTSLQGQRIRRIVDETVASGTFYAIWDARDDAGRRVPAGTYFINASADGNLMKKKVVQIR